MAFLLYFFVLLISAAGVMFGLDLATSPLPSTPNVPIGRSVQHAASRPEPRHVDAQPDAERKVARASDEVAEDRALTPIYPASPGPAAPMQARPAEPAETTAAEPDAIQQAQTNAPREETEDTVATVAAQTSAPASATASDQRCNIDACASAYRSFTSSDCTYQPLQGPRRLCEKPAVTAAAPPLPEPAPAPAKRAVSVAPVKQQQTATRKKSRQDELAEVERVVRRLTSGSRTARAAAQPIDLHPQAAAAAADAREMSEVERIVRKMTRGRSAGDISVIDGTGRVIVVHTGESRVQAYRD